MVTLSLEYILFAIIAGAAFAAVLLFVTAKFLDIQGYRYQLDAQRYAIDILNLIISNSPIVERFPNEEPNRIILSSEKLDEYEWKPWDPCCDSSMVDSNTRRKYWEKNFEVLEFEYHLTVEDLVNKMSWTISNLYFNETECYHRTMRVSARADVPVAISYGKEKHPGKATLTLKKTPLSQLAFFLSEAFLRAEEAKNFEDRNYVREVVIDKDYITRVSVNGNRICIHAKVGDSTKPICKYFYRKGQLSLDSQLDDLSVIRSKCVSIFVQYSPQSGVSIVI